MGKRMGRPPVAPADQLSEIIQFRLTPKERQHCEQAAEHESITLSTWIRKCLLRAIRGKSKRKKRREGVTIPSVNTDPSGRL
jgi:hypothetical protein